LAKIIYPISIDSNYKEIKIAHNLLIRKITDEEVAFLFNMKNREFTKEGRLEKNSMAGVIPLFDFSLTQSVMTNTTRIFDSTYILITEDSADVPTFFNRAIKLYSPGRTGVLFGFVSTEKEKAMYYLHPNPYYRNGGVAILKTKSQINELIKIYEKVREKKSDDFFTLMMELYLNAISGEKFRNETRFLDLMTILEMLYLPKGNSELQFRLALRIAKMMKKCYGDNLKKVFESINDNKTGLYAIRSKIIHDGKSAKLTDEKREELMELARKSLLIYIEDSNEFTDESLKLLSLS